MKKVGIMGGTFNPVHNAHLAMAQAAYEQYGLDEILFMPSKNPPHKNREEIVSGEHRKRMVQFAIDGYPHFTFSDFELCRPGITYTSETLQLLKQEHPDWEIYFILGGDSLADLEKWHKPEKILKYGTILAVPRESLHFKETEKLCKKLSLAFSGSILPVKMKQLGISSSRIRKKIKKGESLTGVCPEKVCRYIKLHGLYQEKVYSYSPGIIEKEGITEDLYVSLYSSLRPKRYRHTIGVAHTAAALAGCHGNPDSDDMKRAEIAGLLHDCAKYLTGPEMISLCEKNGVELSPAEKSNPALIHGKLGAFVAKTRYGITDEEILSAICYHTTGRPAMSFLEKIIYIADYIEPGRRMNSEPYSLPQIRQVCFQNPDEGLIMILTNTINYLKQGVDVIDEMTIKTYEYYAKERREANGK